jgi:hypothetical protein
MNYSPILIWNYGPGKEGGCAVRWLGVLIGPAGIRTHGLLDERKNPEMSLDEASNRIRGQPRR